MNRRRSPDPLTRATRDAANLAAASVVLFTAFWFLTTQVAAIRETLPFTLDPYDAVASYAALALPVIVGATWLRSVRNRGPVLDPAVARRIRIGTGLALATIGASLLADALAYLAPPAGASVALPAAVLALWLATSVAALKATVALVRARGASAGVAASVGAVEPDLLDDGLALVRTVAPLPAVRRLVDATDGFLSRSRLSPRRHRLAVGVLAAVVGSVALVVWHAVVEGPPTVEGAVVFGLLAGVGILAIYLLTLGPLRILRS